MITRIWQSAMSAGPTAEVHTTSLPRHTVAIAPEEKAYLWFERM